MDQGACGMDASNHGISFRPQSAKLLNDWRELSAQEYLKIPVANPAGAVKIKVVTATQSSNNRLLVPPRNKDLATQPDSARRKSR